MELYDVLLDELGENAEPENDVKGIEHNDVAEREPAETKLPKAAEELEIDSEDMKALEEMSAKRKGDVSFLGSGERKSGGCMKSICQGEFSSYACMGCIGKTSDHKTK